MSTMDGQLLANGVVRLKGYDLKLVYALLCKTNMGSLLTSKSKDLITKGDSDHFMKHLESEVQKLDSKSDEELQVDLFIEMTKLLKLRGLNYSLQKEIEDQSATIVDEVYDLFLKQNKKLLATNSYPTPSSKLQHIIVFQMNQLFQGIDSSFQSFTIQDQEKFAAEVNKYILSLPEEKQKQIKDRLGIDDLTEDIMRKTLATSGTSIVFAILVEVGGFAFYTTATSLLASFAGIFGLTLPFGIYTGLTSTIAVLANPLFLIPFLLGGGILLINQQNKSLKKKLLPIILMQITLPLMSDETVGDPDYSSFINNWTSRLNHYYKIKNEITKYEDQEKSLTLQIEIKQNLIAATKKNKMTQQIEISKFKSKVQSSLINSDLNSYEVSSNFEKLRMQYTDKTTEISNLVSEKNTSISPPGLFAKVNAKINQWTTSQTISQKEKEAASILLMLVEEILLPSSPYFENEQQHIQEIISSIQTIDEQIQEEQKLLTSLENNIKITKKNFQIHDIDRKSFERNNYGFQHLV